MTEQHGDAARPDGAFGRVLFGIAKALAVFGGVLSCIMATVVAISVFGRYAFSAPINGDYDIVGILSGCAIFAFLPYCQLVRGNVLADFFTQRAPDRVKAALDAFGNMLFLIAMILFTWRLYHGMLEMQQSSEQIAAFAFYRWWTIPFDLFCAVVMICAILYSLLEDIEGAKTGHAAERPAASGE